MQSDITENGGMTDSDKTDRSKSKITAGEQVSDAVHDGIEAAAQRIESALGRIAALADRPSVSGPSGSGPSGSGPSGSGPSGSSASGNSAGKSANLTLEKKHQVLRNTVAVTLEELDSLIESLENLPRHSSAGFEKSADSPISSNIPGQISSKTPGQTETEKSGFNAPASNAPETNDRKSIDPKFGLDQQEEEV